MEANQEKRDKYLEEIRGIDKGKLVYIDESGIDMNIAKDRGWGRKKEILRGKKSGRNFQRTNIVSGLNVNKSIAPMVFNGSCNTIVFNSWVEKALIKELEAGQIIIMDNASFHQSQRTRELIESVGCRLIFLPPYSPDYNPIEKFWANMKRWIKQRIANFEQLLDALTEFFNISNTG